MSLTDKPAVRFATYERADDIIGEIKGQTTTGEYLVAVSREPTADGRVRVGFAYLSAAEVCEIRSDVRRAMQGVAMGQSFRTVRP